ncbi:MAG: DUF1343 domain-containing protein [Calditrichia bacterium]
MNVLCGLDILQQQDFRTLRGRKIGLLCNQASINKNYEHIISVMLPFHDRKQFTIQAVFGPQHGLWGHTQDNMIEWEGYHDKYTGLTIYSLYGQHRKPTPEMLRGVDLFVADLQDVGSRYYTFMWTMALAMEACQEAGIPVLVLDRPNPISGERAAGTVLDPQFSSFVGLYPLPQRHAMTLGEIALYLKENYFSDLDLKIVKMKAWKRRMYFAETGVPWAVPSPNMPAWETAVVYPGMCLLEATNISEGRGTTRPFETFGAPWISGRTLSKRLNQLELPGVFFRPIQYLPTFDKYQDQICEGAFIHVTDRDRFKPVLTTLALLQEIQNLYPSEFEWVPPPYEYEYEKLPIDILLGNGWLRQMIMDMTPLPEIEETLNREIISFEPVRQKYLMYG